jgi:hypothetical protein
MDLLPNEKKFDPNKYANFPWVYKMLEKRQTSQGYIIRIFQHFASKHETSEYY